MRDVAESLGARFAVVWLPTDVYVFEREVPALQSNLQQRVAAAGIPSIDLFPTVMGEQRVAGLYLPNDGHFTERGNRVAGRAVASWMLQSPALANVLRK
jgi:hypothetical protein